ncbi:hypothetical protein ACQKD4_03610 [Exiguobacterium sp. NPDC077395]|uniref:hypothetical protein n=1 Tax=Exiguobacterium sp. NPDC077395 TaxID=3390563 RepID=UPI003D06C242
MIEISLSDEIIRRHKDFIFGENKSKENRLYQKLLFKYENEDSKYEKALYKFILRNLEDIIIGNIKTLFEIKEEFSKRLNRLSKEKQIVFVKELDIFHEEYLKFYVDKVFNAYEFQKLLQINICPYCATQYIFLYESSDGKTRGTLDHFIDKARYPIFSVSIYNLVPCCKVCNSDFKGRKEMDVINFYSPYEKGIIENISFSKELVENKEEIIVPKVVRELNLNDESTEIDYVNMFLGIGDDFNIQLDYSNVPSDIARKIKGNIELFKVLYIYNIYHKTTVQDAIKKAYLYNYIYRKQLYDAFGGFFSSEEELKQILMPNKKWDDKLILNKLLRDILLQETKNFMY